MTRVWSDRCDDCGGGWSLTVVDVRRIREGLGCGCEGSGWRV
jgi:hypothetical protein